MGAFLVELCGDFGSDFFWLDWCGLGSQPDHALHVVDEVGQADLGLRAVQADGADEQAHTSLLSGEDEIALALNLAPCFTPVESPESNGMAEAFVKTLKRDYVRVSPIPNTAAALALIDNWMEDWAPPGRRRYYCSISARPRPTAPR
jgi:transposase InsO family protein